MKKNLMSVLILALVLVNTILTAILAIGIIPSVKKSNQLVETVASAINLELNGANGESAASVPMAQIETYDLENEMTSYTYEEFRDDQQAVQDVILKNLRTMFDSDFIVSVGFSSVTCQ